MNFVMTEEKVTRTYKAEIGGRYFNIPIRTTNLNNNVMTNIYTRDGF